MAGLPTPAVIIIATAIESVIVVRLLPDYAPGHWLVSIFLPLLALHAGLWAFYMVFVYPFFVTPLRHLPQPKGGWPILGHGLALLNRPAGRDFGRWLRETPNDGLIYCRGFLHKDRVIVTDPKTLGDLLVTKAYDFEKPAPLRRLLLKFIGDGLILVEGDHHRFLRKTMMPSFSFRHIKDLYPIFWDKSMQLTQGMVQQIAENSEDAEKSTAVVEINHWANQVTMDIIGLAAMGRDFQSLKNNDDPLVQNFEELLEPTLEKQAYFALNIFGSPAIIERLPWRINWRIKTITGLLHEICMKLVYDKKMEMKSGGKDHKDIISLLIRANSFSDEQLVDQMLTFLAAGHETTSSAFTWTTYLLAKYPKIQADLRKEVQDNVPSTQILPADTDLGAILESLPILNGVCNEVLRLYPTVPLTMRTCTEDRVLLGQVIPKGTEILLAPVVINRLESLWGPQAAEFLPERWIDTDEKTGEQRPNNSGGAVSNYANLTFLHGPRSCIGQGFAKAELRALVAATVGSFQMDLSRPNEEVVPDGTITTKPKNGMHLRLRHLGAW